MLLQTMKGPRRFMLWRIRTLRHANYLNANNDLNDTLHPQQNRMKKPSNDLYRSFKTMKKSDDLPAKLKKLKKAGNLYRYLKTMKRSTGLYRALKTMKKSSNLYQTPETSHFHNHSSQ